MHALPKDGTPRAPQRAAGYMRSVSGCCAPASKQPCLPSHRHFTIPLNQCAQCSRAHAWSHGAAARPPRRPPPGAGRACLTRNEYDVPWKPYLRTWKRLYRSQGSAYMYASAGIVWWNAVSNTATCAWRPGRLTPVRAHSSDRSSARMSRHGVRVTRLIGGCVQTQSAHRPLWAPAREHRTKEHAARCHPQRPCAKPRRSDMLARATRVLRGSTCGLPGKILAAALMPLRLAGLCLQTGTQRSGVNYHIPLEHPSGDRACNGFTPIHH